MTVLCLPWGQKNMKGREKPGGRPGVRGGRWCPCPSRLLIRTQGLVDRGPRGSTRKRAEAFEPLREGGRAATRDVVVLRVPLP